MTIFWPFLTKTLAKIDFLIKKITSIYFRNAKKGSSALHYSNWFGRFFSIQEIILTIVSKKAWRKGVENRIAARELRKFA